MPFRGSHSGYNSPSGPRSSPGSESVRCSRAFMVFAQLELESAWKEIEDVSGCVNQLFLSALLFLQLRERGRPHQVEVDPEAGV